MEKELNGKLCQIPEHVAIILDGNGRWARKRLMPRNMGHSQGAKVVEQICEDAWDLGIKYLTVYAFSTENWNRPQKEVNALMKLLRRYLVDCIERTSKNNMRVRVIGEKSRLADDIREAIDELERVSAGNTGLNFTIALNYGSPYFERYQDTWDVMAEIKNTELADFDRTQEIRNLPGIRDSILYQKAEMRISLPREWQSPQMLALGGLEALTENEVEKDKQGNDTVAWSISTTILSSGLTVTSTRK